MAFFRVSRERTVNRSYDFQVPEQETESANNGIPATAFGTPVIDNVYFNEGVYIDRDGNERQFSGLHINQMTLAVTQTKNIVKTAIQGRNGTIKEYISDGDYVITASGSITSEGNVFPEEDVQAFHEIVQVPQQVRVTSSFLNDNFGIFWIVLESVTVAEKRGYRNEVNISFTAVSDFDLSLEEITEN